MSTNGLCIWIRRTLVSTYFLVSQGSSSYPSSIVYVIVVLKFIIPLITDILDYNMPPKTKLNLRYLPRSFLFAYSES